METFQSFNSLQRQHILHIANTWKPKLLETIPYYFEYICAYVINADVWLYLLDIIVDTLIQNQSEDYYTAFVFFQRQMEHFPEHVQQSIFMNIGLRLGFVLYSPVNNQFDYVAFTNWIAKEIQKKKAQYRALIPEIEID